MKKPLSLFLSGVLVVSSALPVAGAASTGVSYTDAAGHWAGAAISEWSDLGMVKGYNGQFRPDDSITRGEFAVILDRVMAYQAAANNGFSDLGQDFYTDAILKAAYSGVIKGFSDGTVQPVAKISRQDAMCMIARAFSLHADGSYQIKAGDAESVAAYAVDSVAALESMGIVTGRADGKMYPNAEITRAEVVTILNNLVSKIYSAAGIYSDTIDETGDIVINTPGVTLKGVTVNGDLVIAPGVGSGDCTLDDVTVTGNVVVLGGGVNSVKLLGSSSVAGKIYISKVGDAVRVYAENGVEIPVVVVEDGSDEVRLEGTFASVTVNTAVKVTLPAGTTVQNLALNAKAEVAGSGTIAKATLSEAASGAKFEVKPAAVSAPSGVNVTIGDKNYTSTGSDLKESTGASAGGGGGGGGTSATVSTTGVTLYVNETGIAGTAMSGGYSFDLSGYADTDYISGIKIATSSTSTYTVGAYTISTNTKVPISTFLSMLGLSNSSNVTLGKIRLLGDSCSIAGAIAGGSALEVLFNVGDSGPYAYQVSEAGGVTTTTATLKDSAADMTLSELGESLAADPVALLVGSVANTSATYSLRVTDGGLTFSRSYAYQDISGLNTETLLEKIGAKGDYTTLDDLTGMQIRITYPSGSATKTLALVFA